MSVMQKCKDSTGKCWTTQTSKTNINNDVQKKEGATEILKTATCILQRPQMLLKGRFDKRKTNCYLWQKMQELY